MSSEDLASQARDTMHARLFGEKLSASRQPVANAVTPLRAAYTGIWSPFDYWEPTYSCVQDVRIPIGLVGDGAKWLCGPKVHQQGCKVLSLGSNFDDSFEQAIHNLTGCSSYIVDPTLAPRDRNGRLRSFVERIEQHGSVLNTTVGVGASSEIKVRLAGQETRYATLVSLRELLLSKYGAHIHLNVVKEWATGSFVDGCALEIDWPEMSHAIDWEAGGLRPVSPEEPLQFDVKYLFYRSGDADPAGFRRVTPKQQFAELRHTQNDFWTG